MSVGAQTERRGRENVAFAIQEKGSARKEGEVGSTNEGYFIRRDLFY